MLPLRTCVTKIPGTSCVSSGCFKIFGPPCTFVCEQESIQHSTNPCVALILFYECVTITKSDVLPTALLCVVSHYDVRLYSYLGSSLGSGLPNKDNLNVSFSFRL